MGRAYRNPNGYGSIKKLSGKRRRPYAVVVTTGWEMQNGKAVQIQRPVSYHETKKDAMYELAKYNRLMFDVDMRKMTFQEVFEALYNDEFVNLKQGTLKTYTSAYAKCKPLYSMKMIDIRKAHMQRIINSYSHLSESSQKNIIKLLHAMYTFCMENDICEKDYSQYLQLTSEQEMKNKTPFSRSEIVLLWSNKDRIFDFQTGLMKESELVGWILFMIYTGVRIGEMMNIHSEDVHIDERYIRVRGTKTQSAFRIIPIHKEIIEIVADNLSDEGEYLFTIKGKRIGEGYFRTDYFYPLCKELGMNHKPHECRHSFISYAAASKLNPVLLKKIVGHKSHDITDDTYTHAFIEDLIKEIDKFRI